MSESAEIGPATGDSSESSGPTLSQADEDYMSAASLSAWLRSGQSLQPIQSFIALQPGEMVYYRTDFMGLVFSQTTVRYSTGWFAAFGSPSWLAASIAGSAAYNSYQRSKAKAEAAAQWRLADQGSVHVTSQRICLQGRLKWTDILISDIRALEAHPDGVVVNRLGQSPIKIATPAVAYLYVLLSFLLHGNAIDVPISDDLAARAASAGRPIPISPQTTRQAPNPGPAWHPPAPVVAPQQAVTGAGPLSAWNSAVTPKKVDVLGRQYADWGTRAGAWMIDALAVLGGWVVFIGLIVFGSSLTKPSDQFGDTSVSAAGIALIVASVLGLVVWTVWYHMLVGRESGQTLGKRAVGIQVRDAATGGPIGYGRALGRYLLQILAALILPILTLIDLLWPLWDDRCQTIHDKALNAVVVKLERPKALSKSAMSSCGRRAREPLKAEGHRCRPGERESPARRSASWRTSWPGCRVLRCDRRRRTAVIKATSDDYRRMAELLTTYRSGAKNSEPAAPPGHAVDNDLATKDRQAATRSLANYAIVRPFFRARPLAIMAVGYACSVRSPWRRRVG